MNVSGALRARTILQLVLLSLLTAACTLRIGGPSTLPDAPAPTAVPLGENREAESPGALVSPERPLAAPPGFAVSVFASGLRGPRMMILGPDDVIYVAERGAGRVVRLPDRDGDGVVDSLEIVAADLNAPSSLAFYRDGSLYVAETTRVLHLEAPDTQGHFRESTVVIDGLPSGGHSTRTLLFSPDWETLYVSVGSSCNICREEDPRRAAILAYNPDGSDERVFATGLRNAVGLALHPESGEIWATNNGRDWLGDDLPPETVYLVRENGDYGWPRCHAGRIVDPEFGSPDGCSNVVDPAVEMQAHTAPLGLAFYTGDAFPQSYRGDLFIALHGSWNRSVPVGYKVVHVPMLDGGVGPVQDFVTGWLEDDGSNWGRPVGVITGADGALYISDDSGGRVYRVAYLGD